jgi:transcriptional regulator with XRE-family HTH domain
MHNDNKFGALLGALMEREALSQSEIARRVGITPAAVGGWVHGRTSPDPGRMVLLMGVLVPLIDGQERLDLWRCWPRRVAVARVMPLDVEASLHAERLA